MAVITLAKVFGPVFGGMTMSLYGFGGQCFFGAITSVLSSTLIATLHDSSPKDVR